MTRPRLRIAVGATLALLMALALLLTGCGNTTTTASGLEITDTKVGTGVAVKNGDTVEVDYTGWLYTNGKQGTQFDSSLQTGREPLAFKVGDGSLIKGWEEGIVGMKVGGERTLILPPDLAYGAQGAGNGVIPANATLKFTLKLLSINGKPTVAPRTEEGKAAANAKVDITDTKVGDGAEVKSGDKVTVDYTGWLYVDGNKTTKFDSSVDRGQPFQTQIGVGAVIAGWDQGIVGMKVGGERTLIIPPELAYGSQGSGSAIPPNSTLCFDVKLISIDK